MSLRYALVLALSVAVGCGDDTNGATGGSSGTAGTGGTSGTGGTGGVDAPMIDAPMNMIDANLSCEMLGQNCTSASQCCSGVCNSTTHQCDLGMCFGQGMPCSLNTDCCNLNCNGGACGTAACTQNGNACSSNTQCCSGNCANNMCAAINPTGCTTTGNSCAMGDAGAGSNNCCSLNCQNNTCERASGCQATGDVCYRGGDCCTGICNIASGATAGLCATINSTGAGNCAVDGEPCTGAADCCSRLCVSTVYGGHACQVTSGCRVEGEACITDSECCSFFPGHTPGTDCIVGAGQTGCGGTGQPPCLGRCRNPPGNVCPGSSGTPPGNVCGGAPGSDGSMTARQDCCYCQPPKFDCCFPDLSGVYRCHNSPPCTTNPCPCPNGYDGTPGCCLMAGQQCSFSGECCNGVPCVPDQNGVLRCGTMCIQQGNVCTSTGDCCAGLICNIPPGSPTGTCGTITPTPDGGTPTDGGRIDAPTVDAAPMCALAGQNCSPTQNCCSPLACINVATGMGCSSSSQVCGCVIP